MQEECVCLILLSTSLAQLVLVFRVFLFKGTKQMFGACSPEQRSIRSFSNLQTVTQAEAVTAANVIINEFRSFTTLDEN
jgi:hypothetical protein